VARRESDGYMAMTRGKGEIRTTKPRGSVHADPCRVRSSRLGAPLMRPRSQSSLSHGPGIWGVLTALVGCAVKVEARRRACQMRPSAYMPSLYFLHRYLRGTRAHGAAYPARNIHLCCPWKGLRPLPLEKASGKIAAAPRPRKAARGPEGRSHTG
jgi:hypothetical protein